MIKSNVLLDETLALLNTLLEMDENAVLALVNNRVPCNEALADHPTVQVRRTAENTTVGILGIINALFGVDEKGMGAIMMVVIEETGKPRFIRTTDFVQKT